MTVAETTRIAQGELGPPAPAAPPAALPRYEAHEVRRLARGVLDAMAITDLVYHDLAYAEPLVVDLLYEVLNRTPAGGRVLAIGPNAYLARVLAEQGFDLAIWRYGENLLLQEVLPAGQGLAGEVTPQQLAGGTLPFTGTYDTIVLPLILEHVQANPRLVLEALRPLLAPGGCIVLATGNLGRLGVRLRALRGRAFLPDWKSGAAPALGNAPQLPAYRFYQVGELVCWSEEAGFRVDAWHYSQAQQAFSQALPLTVVQYLALKVRHAVKEAIPSLRECIVMTITRQDEAAAEALLPALVDPGDGRRLHDGRENGHRPLPFVSVVLPTHNRAKLLREALEALFQQTYPAARFEIVLIDDGSQDETPQVIAELTPHAPCRVVVERTTGIGATAARNLGMRLASGEVVAHTDDDCRVPPGWIEAGVRGFERDVAFVAGPVLPKPEQPAGFFCWVMYHPTDNGTYPTSNIFYRREVLLAEGGFDEAFGQNLLGRPKWGWDTDAAWRLLRKGYQVRFRQEAYLYTEIFRLGPKRWLLEGWRASMLPGVLRAVPELRRTLLIGRLFFAWNSLQFELGVGASLLALLRRQPRWLLLWLPWLKFAMGNVRGDWWPPQRWIRIAPKLAFLFAQHVVFVAALVYGSLRARRIML